MKQLKLNIYKGKHGGRRPGSGRKRINSKGVAHRKREEVSARTPLHINFKYRVTIKNKACLKILKGAIINARKMGLPVLHFSLQHNHVHLIVESVDNETLSRGMRSLTVTMAKRMKKGKIQLERYYLHVLKSIRETKNVIHYVLFNEQRHSLGKFSQVDEYSSLLSLPNAMEFIKKFARENKITLHVNRMSDFTELSFGKSYLYQRSISS